MLHLILSEMAACIPDCESDSIPYLPDGNCDFPSRRCMSQSIGQQVAKHLLQSLGICLDLCIRC